MLAYKLYGSRFDSRMSVPGYLKNIYVTMSIVRDNFKPCTCNFPKSFIYTQGPIGRPLYSNYEFHSSRVNKATSNPIYLTTVVKQTKAVNCRPWQSSQSQTAASCFAALAVERSLRTELKSLCACAFLTIQYFHRVESSRVWFIYSYPLIDSNSQAVSETGIHHNLQETSSPSKTITEERHNKPIFIMPLQRSTVFVVFAFTMIITVNCKVIGGPISSQQLDARGISASGKQLIVGGAGAETSAPDFVRLVVMRLIYGLATSMGVEDRLENLFNGAFVPPNADSDFFGLGGFGGGGGGNSALGGLLGLADLEGILEGDELFDDGGL
ncbi:uncharacterized protein LOC142224707 [Haematobia irritans]|uniref:uncharacterized protein LOC142224707 n=1 Tax=Haematobia irritans TaxID=7368 RepID=UPI003F4F6EE8